MHLPKIIILNNNYPSKENLYGDVFVHSRLKYYLPFFEVQVIGYQPNIEENKGYEYENIKVVNFNDKNLYLDKIRSIDASVIGIHFVEGWLYKEFIKTSKIPIVIWVHGAEALGWYRRLYNVTGFKQALGTIKANVIQLFQFRKIIKHSNRTNNITFVFVSNWMKKIAECDTLSTIDNFQIIPNPIDTNLFQFKNKPIDVRKKILLIRSFDSKKYANDIAIAAIKILSKKSFFNDLEFIIYGRGKYFKKLTDLVSHHENISINNFYVENNVIPKLHEQHGVFLCPTRQDAQGVSMCEAMSSGLVIVSSNCTAIPEFVKDSKSGYLTKNANELANVIEHIYNNPDEFKKVSEEASKSIALKSGHKTVINKEIEILKKISEK